MKLLRLSFVLFTLTLPAHVKSQDLNYTRSWIGNSFGSGEGTNGAWVQNNVSNIWVSEDGAVYTVSGWDEGKRECGIYKDGEIIGQLENVHPREGGEHPTAIAGDSDYIYLGNGHSLRRYTREGKHAELRSGSGRWKNEIEVTSGDIAGLAVDSKKNLLFATLPAEGEVRVFAIENGIDAQHKWKLDRPYRGEVDGMGTFWVIQRGTAEVPPLILRFDEKGTRLSQTISGPAGWDPVDLAFTADGRLLVADNGPDQNIKIYSDLDSPTPRLADTFGKVGGIFHGTPGKVEPLKFDGLTAIGMDSSGNLYVAQNRHTPDQNAESGGGTVIESYNLAGARLNWRLEGLEFVDGAAFVPGTEGTEIHTKYGRYTVDYTRESGKEATYAGFTMDRFTFPEDPRWLKRDDHRDWSTVAFVRIVDGKKLVFNTTMWGSRLEVYRFEPTSHGEIMIPCAMIGVRDSHSGAPRWGEWIWVDENGNGTPDEGEYEQPSRNDREHGHFNRGWYVDSTGGVWITSHNPTEIRHIPFGGFSAQGVPQYDWMKEERIEAPAPFTDLSRVIYLPETDTMYLSGYTQTHPPEKAEKAIGKVLARYDQWSSQERNPTWTTEVNFARGAASLAAAGDYLFIAHDGHAYQPDTGFVEVIKASDGSPVGRMDAGEFGSGRVDILYGIEAFKRENGEYVILVEEDWHARIMMYRWKPEPEVAKPKSP